MVPDFTPFRNTLKCGDETRIRTSIKLAWVIGITFIRHINLSIISINGYVSIGYGKKLT